MKREIWFPILLGVFGGVVTAANPAPKPGVEAHRSGPFRGMDSTKSGMGAGIWSVRVTGTGQDNPCWTSDPVGVETGKAYRLSYQARTDGTGGCVVSGLG